MSNDPSFINVSMCKVINITVASPNIAAFVR